MSSLDSILTSERFSILALFNAFGTFINWR
jgi:hypothetical protein